MLYTDETTKRRRAILVTLALLMASVTAGVASAQQTGALSPLPPVPSGNNGAKGPGYGVRLSALGLQPVLQRAADLQRASQLRVNQAPSGARISYSAAHQAFGDLLSTLGAPNQWGVANANSMPVVSSQQAADDVRLLRSAANRAKDINEGNRLKKAAQLYATGAKEYLTGQLREALLETGTSAPAVVLRGDPKEADAVTKDLTAPPPPKQPAPPPVPPTPPQPAPNPLPPVPPPPAPNPVPDPNQPAPNLPPNPLPAPQPNPVPNPPNPSNPPAPVPPGVPPPPA